jgi:hypothetical protein
MCFRIFLCVAPHRPNNNNATSNAPISSFTITDGPVHIDLAVVNDSMALVCAVTGKGHLFIYKHEIGSQEKKGKKPVKAAHQVKVQTEEGAPLVVYGAFVTNSFNERLESFESDSELTLYLVYGSHVAPVIEKMVNNNIIDFFICILIYLTSLISIF